MRPIPQAMRKELATRERMKHCVLEKQQGKYGYCEGRIEWEHVFIYSSMQISELWNIIGACHKHHSMKEGHQDIKQAFQRSSLAIATDDDLAKYPRANWGQIKLYLSTV